MTIELKKPATSVIFNDLDIVVNGPLNDQGACKSLDCNDQSIGKARTVATSGVDDALTVVSKGFADAKITGAVAAPTNTNTMIVFSDNSGTASKIPNATISANNNKIQNVSAGTASNDVAIVAQINGGGAATTTCCTGFDATTTNYTGGLVIGHPENLAPLNSWGTGATPNYTITGTSSFSPTQTLLAIADTSLFIENGIVNIQGDTGYVSGLRKVIQVEPTGIVIDKVFQASETGILNAFNSFIPGKQQGASVNVERISGSTWQGGLNPIIGGLYTFSGASAGVVQGVSLINTSAGTVPQPSVFVRISNSQLYDGYYQALILGNDVTISTPFLGTDSGNWEYVIISPVMTAPSFSGVFQLSGRVETQSTSAPGVITYMQWFKSTASNFQQIESTIREFKNLYLPTVHNINLLDITSGATKYALGIGTGMPPGTAAHTDHIQLTLYGVS
jgi:hypothetical protein